MNQSHWIEWDCICDYFLIFEQPTAQRMTLPSAETIDISRLSRIYGNTVATYKFYWFVSIIDLVCANPGRRVFSFNEIIAGMIAEAWYPIHYFRLSFGKSDSLESAIHRIQELLNIPIDAEKNEVSGKILANVDNAGVRRILTVFTRNVPYWFLSPWIPGATVRQVELLSREAFNNCPYAIVGKDVYINDPWVDYLTTNALILKDFSYWNLTQFIQKRNPNVPDIPSKLVKPIQRGSLSRQHRFWDKYIDATGPVHCIYTDIEMGRKDYDLDHFIPWSFVVHDQLWNLLPAHPSVNSSKSDNIPPLDRYLSPMARLQHEALRVNYHLNQSDVLLEDYLVFRCSIPELVELPEDRFLSLFKDEFTPMAQTAANMGFAPWTNLPAYV